jgi:hypothetical protein
MVQWQDFIYSFPKLGTFLVTPEVKRPQADKKCRSSHSQVPASCRSTVSLQAVQLIQESSAL